MKYFTDKDTVVAKQAAEADCLLKTVQAQVASLIDVTVKNCKINLVKENEKLLEEVNKLKGILLSLDGSSDSPPSPTTAQKVQAPTKPENFPKVEKPSITSTASVKNDGQGVPATSKSKPKKAKTEDAKPSKDNSSASQDIDVGRLDFRVGHIISVEKHPDADSLYVEKIDVGEDKPRTVVSGLVKHIAADEFNGKMVVLLCNLKPAKMRGVTSEAMVMCASTPEKVEVLAPPEGSVPGDLIEFKGFQRKPDSILNPKKKIFETCAPFLKTNSEGVATYKDVPFEVLGRGFVLAKSLFNVQIK